ncbi:MAG: AAA family ATPase [Salinisphaera sp.]|nr:AAA family ATPase [Salinisphaera sp.]
MQRLSERIVGQREALGSLEATLKIIKADIGDPGRPLHVGLLLGPTGVGKTELVRVLAEAIHGRRDALCRIDMNTLAQEHYAAALTGAPPGYVGSKEGTTLLDPERIAGSFGAPGIVLFDEIEKAGSEVVRALLNVFDNGQLTLTSGAKTIDFRNTMIFMTSNCGAREIERYLATIRSGWRRWLPISAARQRRGLHDLVDRALLERFDPEFVNRIDTISLFNWIEQDMLDALIDIEVDKLNTRLARIGRRAELDPAARAVLRKAGFDRRYGARAMGRAVRRHIEYPLAEALADADLSKRDPADIQTMHSMVDTRGDIHFFLTTP